VQVSAGATVEVMTGHVLLFSSWISARFPKIRNSDIITASLLVF
jgi:hypothetical protein